jgi:hypothetical protein
MAVELQQLIKSFCSELLKTNNTFQVAQRSAFVELFKNEFDRIALNDNYFLGIEEISFSITLRAKRKSWIEKIVNKFLHKSSHFSYEIVSPSCPGAIDCKITFRRNDKSYNSKVSIDNKEINSPLYVDIT